MPPLSKGVAGGLRRWSGSSNTGAEESTEEAAKAGDLAAGYTAFQEAAKAVDSCSNISEAFVELIGANGLDDEAMEQQLKVLQGTFERLLLHSRRREGLAGQGQGHLSQDAQGAERHTPAQA